MNLQTGFTYEDFTLRIEEELDGFRVRLVRSPYGPREAHFIPPFSPQELTSLLDSLGRRGTSLPSGSRADGGTTRDLLPASGSVDWHEPSLESIGGRLFRSLFNGKILECFLRSLSHVESLSRTGVRVRIELAPDKPALASLAALPWELLYRAESRDFLSRNLMTPVVRYLDVSHLQTAAPPIRGELRIVVLMSSPKGAPALDHEGELARVESAWGKRGDIRIIQPERPTLRALRATLRETMPHAFHFIGHGTFDPVTGHGGLLFEDVGGRPHHVTGTLVAETLKIGQQVRLVFLNSCEGATVPRREAQDPYHGVASALLLGGVASVLAMQFPVTDRAAVVFSEALYAALAAGDPIEGAVAEGRLAVHQDRPDSWEWATPALYLGAADGEVFRRARPKASKPADNGTAGLEAGLTLLDLKKYDAALDAFEKILKSRPEEADAHYYLALARMKGKQPRTHPLDLIRKVEEDLRVAVEIDGDRAHSLYLWALVKENYYAWNGLRIPPPPIEELLAAAGRAQVDKAHLRLLLDHLTTSPSRVREAVEAALGKNFG